MNKATIPATSYTPAKTFEVGDVWVVTHGTIPLFVAVTSITDNNIIFENLATGRKSIRIPRSQHSGYSKHAYKDKRKVIHMLFYLSPEFLT